MIEVVVTCDRCGKKGGDGLSIGTGLSITNTNRAHLCSTCSEKFWSWINKHKSETKAA